MTGGRGGGVTQRSLQMLSSSVHSCEGYVLLSPALWREEPLLVRGGGRGEEDVVSMEGVIE